MCPDSLNPFARKDMMLKALLAHAEKAAPRTGREELLRFVRLFYAPAVPDDIVNETPETLYAIALHMWELGKVRKRGEPLVEAFNPRLLKKGWATAHSAIAIINDDMPFLVDSITGGLGVTERLRIHVVHHPILNVVRDAKGKRLSVSEPVEDESGKRTSADRESVIYIEIDAESDPERLAALADSMRRILADVRSAVRDWRAMLAKIDETVASLTVNPPPVEPEDQDETVRFLRWLGADNFTFLGYREYRFDGDPAESDFRAIDESGLGILRDPNRYILRGAQGLSAISPEIRHFLRERDKPIIITKANVKATVHRPVHMDYVGVKIYDENGHVVGERRFVGLFTSQSYAMSPYDVPLLRRKVQNVQRRALYDRRSHAGKALRHILETFPRDELFQIEEDDLLSTGLGILHLLERPRSRAFIRRDRFERFVSALVFVPRDNYHSGLRAEIANILCEAFKGEVSVYYAQLSEDRLARWHFIIRTRPGEVPDADEAEIDRRIAEAVAGWSERLREHLIATHGEEEGLALYRRYGQVFSTGYQEDFPPALALRDIEKLRMLEDGAGIAFDFYRKDKDGPHDLRLKMYHGSDIVPLSDCLPMLEHLGLRVISENAYDIAGGELGCIHDFALVTPGNAPLDLPAVKPLIEDLLSAVWSGRVEDDPYNSLALAAGLDLRRILVLRAYGRYLRQIGLPFGQAYIAHCLRDHPTIARGLIELFETRLDPSRALDGEARKQAALSVSKSLNEALDAVTGIDEDRILRVFIDLIMATLRTNFWQDLESESADGVRLGLAFKLDSRRIEEAPQPRPWREIYVYSPRVEGVHLRWGPIARGGLRWSDRRQDFRTEVLGLVKAQQVKNAVIVPVGAKGGFVPKHLPSGSDREAIQAEGIACYRIFVASLLSLTDNLVEGKVVPPGQTVCHDEDDPYLVVAADKGTATFSDIANRLAEARGFWLMDAFASGGSHGYDHKAMAITASGAWVSVQRHFREIGINVQKDPVTVIGVGDMSGDVFGNGMLLSKSIRLIAAFDHRHIFLDPDPDPAISWRERSRLFALPRSSWDDYDRSLLSAGGGIWPRSAKSIPLTPEVQRLLGIDKPALAPAALMRAILRAEADLLWFGGIGTYVKATTETHAEAGDRSNDAIRVDADELRVKVVGEGANLGMTQRSRIEFARRGGRLNTDFIDNSAGVDCSDKEVNIKILLAEAMRTGDIDREKRDVLLREMTDEVAEIVLSDNYLQTGALSQAEARAVAARESHAGLIRLLEREGTLDREIEYLPSEEQFSELALSRKGLTRPELSVLMAYAKLSLKAILLQSDLLNDAYLRPELEWSFPKPLRKDFAAALDTHRLRRELICAVLVNQIVNRAGLCFIYEVREEAGFGVDQIAAAYLMTRDIFGLERIWQDIDALDYKVPSAIQTLMHLEIADFVKAQTIWFLRNEERPFNLPAIVARYSDGIGQLLEAPETVLSPLGREAYANRIGMLREHGVPGRLAARVASLQMLGFASDVEAVSDGLDWPVIEVGRAWSAIGARIGFDWLRGTSDLIATDDHWDRLAARAVLDDLSDQQRELTRHILGGAKKGSGAEAVESWFGAQELTSMRTERLINELKASGGMTVAKLSFAARHLRSILARAIAG